MLNAKMINELSLMHFFIHITAIICFRENLYRSTAMAVLLWQNGCIAKRFFQQHATVDMSLLNFLVLGKIF